MNSNEIKPHRIFRTTGSQLQFNPSTQTYLKKNNKKDEWLPLKYKTVVCCFISYKKLSNKELFGFKIVLFILYILLIYDDLFHRIVNIAVF